MEESSMFCNSSHLEWCVRLSDTILKGYHPRTIPAKLSSEVSEENGLNAKPYDVRRINGRTPSDCKGSPGLLVR